MASKAQQMESQLQERAADLGQMSGDMAAQEDLNDVQKVLGEISGDVAPIQVSTSRQAAVICGARAPRSLKAASHSS